MPAVVDAATKQGRATFIKKAMMAKDAESKGPDNSRTDVVLDQLTSGLGSKNKLHVQPGRASELSLLKNSRNHQRSRSVLSGSMSL
jgi:hypothetical protein